MEEWGLEGRIFCGGTGKQSRTFSKPILLVLSWEISYYTNSNLWKTVKEDKQDTPAFRLCVNLLQKYGRMPPGKQKLFKSDVSPLELVHESSLDFTFVCIVVVFAMEGEFWKGIFCCFFVDFFPHLRKGRKKKTNILHVFNEKSVVLILGNLYTKKVWGGGKKAKQTGRTRSRLHAATRAETVNS